MISVVITTFNTPSKNAINRNIKNVQSKSIKRDKISILPVPQPTLNTASILNISKCDK